MRRHRFAEAVTFLEPLVAESPESDELRAVLGEAYLKLGRFKEAEREYRASLRTIPSDANKLTKLGDALYRQRRVPEAMDYYKRALSASDDF